MCSSDLKDYHQSQSALDRANARKAAMSETLMSLPENLRWAAKSWKEENPGEPLTKDRVNYLLDKQKFEKPEWGPNGDLLNPGKIDPRIPLEDDGSKYMANANISFADNGTNEKGDVQGSDIKGPVSREAAERWHNTQRPPK